MVMMMITKTTEMVMFCIPFIIIIIHISYFTTV